MSTHTNPNAYTNSINNTNTSTTTNDHDYYKVLGRGVPELARRQHGDRDLTVAVIVRVRPISLLTLWISEGLTQA